MRSGMRTYMVEPNPANGDHSIGHLPQSQVRESGVRCSLFFSDYIEDAWTYTSMSAFLLFTLGGIMWQIHDLTKVPYFHRFRRRK